MWTYFTATRGSNHRSTYFFTNLVSHFMLFLSIRRIYFQFMFFFWRYLNEWWTCLCRISDNSLKCFNVKTGKCFELWMNGGIKYLQICSNVFNSEPVLNAETICCDLNSVNDQRVIYNVGNSKFPQLRHMKTNQSDTHPRSRSLDETGVKM